MGCTAVFGIKRHAVAMVQLSIYLPSICSTPRGYSKTFCFLQAPHGGSAVEWCDMHFEMTCLVAGLRDTLSLRRCCIYSPASFAFLFLGLGPPSHAWCDVKFTVSFSRGAKAAISG